MNLKSFEVTIATDGNLVLTLESAADQAELREQLETKGYWDTLLNLFEGHSTNGSYAPFDASDGNPFVGLTSAPCIAESLDHADDGSINIVGEFWYSPNYAIECELKTLADTGRFIFEHANK